MPSGNTAPAFRRHCFPRFVNASHLIILLPPGPSWPSSLLADSGLSYDSFPRNKAPSMRSAVAAPTQPSDLQGFGVIIMMGVHEDAHLVAVVFKRPAVFTSSRIYQSTSPNRPSDHLTRLVGKPAVTCAAVGLSTGTATELGLCRTEESGAAESAIVWVRSVLGWQRWRWLRCDWPWKWLLLSLTSGADFPFRAVGIPATHRTLHAPILAVVTEFVTYFAATKSGEALFMYPL